MPTSSSTAEAPSPFTEGRAQPPVPRRRRWPSSSTMLVAGFWLWTRAALVVFTVMGCWLLRVDSGGRLSGPTRWFLERFTWWDSFHFLRIVDRGYLSLDAGGGDQAFFPGYPLAIALVRPLTGGNAALAGFAVSVAAGTAAAVVLWHLGRLATGTRRGGQVAVTLLAVAPYGFFLVTVYSEALFLACALGAWAAGLTRRWWLAGVLAALASTVRINGIFLTAALLVLYLQQAHGERRAKATAESAAAERAGAVPAAADGAAAAERAGAVPAAADGAAADGAAAAKGAPEAGPLRALGRRGQGLRSDVLALALPLIAVGGYFAYLRTRTGTWNAWQTDQDIGWHRGTAAPWTGIHNAWMSVQSARAPDLVLSRCADLVVTLAGVALLVVLLALRRWPEAVFVLLNVAVLICSTTLVSAPRYALTWFPVYMLVAELAVRPRWRWLVPAIVVACLPLLGVVALSFAAHRWTA